MNLFESAVNFLVQEEVQIPPGSLNVPRSQMPQIASDQVPRFLDFLRSQGISVRQEAVPASTLRGIQAEVDVDKIRGMVAKGVTSDDKPLLAANDRYIMDGHHRWMAAYNVDRDQMIKIWKCGVPIRALIQFAKEFDGVKFKAMGESRKRK